MHFLLAVLLAVIPLSSSTSGLSALLMARIAVAEAGGAGLWGSEEAAAEAQVAVMWVVRHRMGDNLTVSEVADGFTTSKDSRPWWPGIGPYTAAIAVLRMSPDDAPHDCHYVLSQQDVERLGFPDGEMVLRANGALALHFYSPGGWPG